jgi:hypothetical protein
MVEIATTPAVQQVTDVVSDAIPGQGCVLAANPTVALLDDRFTADAPDCPQVVDGLG